MGNKMQQENKTIKKRWNENGEKEKVRRLHEGKLKCNKNS